MAFFGGYVAPPVRVVVHIYGSVGDDGDFNYMEVYGCVCVCGMISRPLVGVCAHTGPSGRRVALCMAVKSLILVCCCAVCPEVAAIGESGPDYSSVGPFH